MPNKKNTEVSVPLSEEAKALLASSFPVEQGFTRKQLPRLGLYSQDQTEGKGKNLKVIAEAGTFYTEVQSEEEVEGEDGKMYKPWEKTELGDSTEAIIVFKRKQLKFYNSDDETYVSSPVYDTDDQMLPLFKDGKEIYRDIPENLQAIKEFQGLTAKGKPTSKLEVNRILYVLHDGTLYQLNLRGGGMYNYLKYERTCIPSMVVTRFGSEAMQNGKIEWSQMTFSKVRDIDQGQFEELATHLQEIKNGIEAEKNFFKNRSTDAAAPVAAERIGPKDPLLDEGDDDY